MKNKSEKIQCSHQVWRLLKRNDVYYACGRIHGNGRHSLATRVRDDAIRALIELDSFCAGNTVNGKPWNSESIDETGLSQVSIADGWQMYIDGHGGPSHLGGLKESTKKKYRSHRSSFTGYCLKNSIDCWNQVTKQVLQQYGNHINSRFAPRTVHNDLTMQISVSNWLIMENLIADSCKIKWKLKKPSGSDRYCYTRDEVHRMLELTAANPPLQWLYQTLMVLSHTGLRIGEAINLRWSDINLESGMLAVRDESFSNLPARKRRTVKDGESRTIPIHPKLEPFFRENIKRGYVLQGFRGGQLNVNYAREQFISKVIEPLKAEFPSATDEVGFKDGRFHSFRHFFVSQAFAAGIPECDIKDWMGHSDSKVVEMYRHLRSETAKANILLGDFGTN